MSAERAEEGDADEGAIIRGFMMTIVKVRLLAKSTLFVVSLASALLSCPHSFVISGDGAHTHMQYAYAQAQAHAYKMHKRSRGGYPGMVICTQVAGYPAIWLPSYLIEW